jgi:hypothetical protein
MTARAPTEFNVFNDLSGLYPNREIFASYQDDVLDDQQFARNRGEMLCGYVGGIYSTTAHAWTTLLRLVVRGRNLCTPGSQPEFVLSCIRARCTVDNDFNVGIYDPVATAWTYFTVNSDRTTWKWRGWGPETDYLLAPTDGSAVEYLVGAYVPSPGTGMALVSGVGIFAVHP